MVPPSEVHAGFILDSNTKVSMEMPSRIVLARRKKFLSSEDVLVVAKNESRTILMHEGSEEPRIYTNESKLKLSEKTSVSLSEDSTSDSARSVILRTDESSDALVVSNLSNFVQYPFCSAVWPVLVALAAGIRKTDLDYGWSLAALARTIFHDALFSEYDSEDFTHPESVLLDAYRLGIGDEFLPFISINTSKSNFIAALAASANEDHETAHKLASTVTADQYPQICVVEARAARHDPSLSDNDKPYPTSDLRSVYSKILTDDDLETSALYDSLPELLSLCPDLYTNSVDRETLLEDIEKAKHGVIDGGSIFTSNGNYGLLALAAEEEDQVTREISSFGNETLSTTPLFLIDHLINKNVISENDLPSLSISRPNDESYLWCRISPSTATDQQLKDENFEYEVFRREVLNSNSNKTIMQSFEKLKSGKVLDQTELDEFPLEVRDTAKDICKLITKGLDKSLEYLLEDDTIISLLSDKVLQDKAISIDSEGNSNTLLAKRFLKDAFNSLLYGEWNRSIQKSKEVLRISKDESFRDEALNIMACGYWQLGEDDKAITALKTALEGEYNPALQVNLGIVAQQLDPSSAINHLIDLADEAPTLEQKYQCIKRAFSILLRSEELEKAPEKLKLSSHRLLEEIYLDTKFNDDSVWELTSLLSSNGEDLPAIQISGLSDLRKSMLTIGKAQSEGPIEYIQAIGGLKGESEWISEMQQAAISLVLQFQQADITSAASGVFGMTLLDSGINMPVETELRVQCFTIIGISGSLIGDQGMPNDDLIKRFVQSKTLLGNLDPVTRENAQELFTIASDSLLRCLVVGTAPVVQQFFELPLFLSGAQARRARRTSAFAPLLQEAKKMKRNLKSVKDLGVKDPELSGFANDLLADLDTVIRRIGMYV